MRIVVFNVAASETGALSILKSFFSYINDNEKKNEWYFIVSTDALKSTSPNVHVIIKKYPKKNWCNRIIWELFMAPGMLRDLEPDVIFSLQNTTVLFTRTPQVVYVHQSLPFLRDKKWSYFKRDERILRIYTDVFYHLIKKAAHRAKKIVVQTEWMKKALSDAYGVSRDKIVAVLPSINVPSADASSQRKVLLKKDISFFYPATSFVYKNIDVILRALEILKERGLSPNVRLTIRGNENDYARRIAQEAKRNDLNVTFLGELSRDDVLKLYSESVLLFPSLVETIGLPLLEARMAGAEIIASDMPFSREVLDGYPRVRYFNPNSSHELAVHIESVLRDEVIEEVEVDHPATAFGKKNSWSFLIDNIESVMRDEDSH